LLALDGGAWVPEQARQARRGPGEERLTCYYKDYPQWQE
jgi:hypothetical protein